MRRYFTLAFAVLLLCGSISQAEAGFGTDIGISFPAGRSGGTLSRAETYAAFSFGEMMEELTVTELHGRLKMELKVTNTSDAAYSVAHSDGQLYDFIIMDKNGAELYRWSDGMAFTQALEDVSYPAHESVVYEAELERRAYKKIKDDAVLVVAYLTDTPYRLSTRVPSVTASRTPVMIHGGIIIGNGGWLHD